MYCIKLLNSIMKHFVFIVQRSAVGPADAGLEPRACGATEKTDDGGQPSTRPGGQWTTPSLV